MTAPPPARGRQQLQASANYRPANPTRAQSEFIDFANWALGR